MRKNFGYTLFEILITLAILSLIASIGFVFLGGSRKSSSLNSEAQKIVGYLRQAQSNALTGKNFSNWGVYFYNQPEGNDFYQMFSGATYETASTTETIYFPNGVEFTSPESAASTTITFARITGMPNASTTIIITTSSNPQLSKIILINEVGRVSY